MLMLIMSLLCCCYLLLESLYLHMCIFIELEILTEVGKFLEEMLIYGGGIIKAC